MGADLGGRAGDKGTSGERRVRKLVKLSGAGNVTRSQPCGAQVRGLGQGRHNRKQRGGGIKGSGLGIKGVWLRVSRVGLRIRRAKRKIEGAGRSGENPAAKTPGGREEGPYPKTRPGSGVGARGGALPKGPASAHPPAPPVRPGPGLTAPTASCSSAPSRLSMMAARPGSRPGSRWRRGGGGGGGPTGGRRDWALKPRPCRRARGARSPGLARS